MKQDLMTAIDTGYIDATNQDGRSVYKVSDSANNRVITLVSDWKAAICNIYINDKLVYFQTPTKQKTQKAQRAAYADVVDLLLECSKKYADQMRRIAREKKRIKIR